MERIMNRKFAWTLAFAATVFSLGVAISAQDAQYAPQGANSPAQDPPSRVARVAFTQGNVSLEPSGVDTFSQAELNYPLTAGDRIYVDNNSQAELQTSGLAVRMGNGADVTLSSLTDGVAQFGLAQGSIRVRVRDLSSPPDENGNPQQGTVEIDTPNGAVLVQRAGDIRVDSYPQDDSSVVTVSSGQVEVTGPNLDQIVGPNQSFRFIGNPTQIQQLGLLAPDPLDQLDQQREAAFTASVGVRNDYVSPDMIGASDLDQYGQWDSSPDYGEVWYPSYVAMSWAPYQNGRWAWVAPWGWTWVEAEPWGFAPFHYGRWSSINGRWGWIPGPSPRIWGGRPVRPVYSPALVVFVGSGTGFSAWFPLGPGEAYQPWYHASALYVNRVNVTNIYTRNPGQLRATYSNRTSVVFNTNINNVSYVNRPGATTVVAQRDFAAGRSVAAAQGRVDATVRAQVSVAPVLPHPMITPTAAMAAPQTPARAIPPNANRPALSTRMGVMPPGTPTAANPIQPSAQPNATPSQPIRGNYPEVRTQVPSPATNTPAMAPRAPVPAPVAPVQQHPHAMDTPPQTPQTRPQAAETPAQPIQNRPQAMNNLVQARPLVTNTQPQPVQPSFADQQREIQRVDPGRPLGPQQVQNVREGRPAGPPSQQESTAHPQPARQPPPGRQPPPPPPAKNPH